MSMAHYWTQDYIPEGRMLAVVTAIDAALRMPAIYRLLTPAEGLISLNYRVARSPNLAARANCWLYFNGYVKTPESCEDTPLLQGETFAFGEGWMTGKSKQSACETDRLPYTVAVVLALKIALDAGIIYDVACDTGIDFAKQPDALFAGVLEDLQAHAPELASRPELAEHARLPSVEDILRAYSVAAGLLGLPNPYIRPPLAAARAIAA